MAELEVDGVRLADVSPRAWHMFRTGQVESGERRWIVSPSASARMVAAGWVLLGYDPVGRRWLLWRPTAAVPLVRADVESVEFACARCGATVPDFLSFGVGFPTRAVYCLHHVPWWVRLRMWWREVRGRG